VESLSSLTISSVLEGEHLSLIAPSTNSLPDIIRRLASSGADVYSVIPQKLSLEDLFIRIMGQDRGL
jgi:hypothetical protein